MADITFRGVEYAPVIDEQSYDANLQVDAEIGDELVLSIVIETDLPSGIPMASVRLTGVNEIDALRRYCEMALAQHASRS